MRRTFLAFMIFLAAWGGWSLSWGNAIGSAPQVDAPVRSGLSNADDRIARIEHGLLPPVLIKGEPLPTMNLAGRMTFYKVPGVSIAVIDQGRIDWARGFGYADAASGRKVTPQTRFEAGSISKPVAAAAALHFVEAGKLDLDRNVNDYLKSWKVPEDAFTQEQKVTLRRILSHSAGLTMHGFPGYEAGKPVPTLMQVLNGEKPASTPPIRVDMLPGSAERYSGGGYTVMQQTLVDVLGKPFSEIMQRAVLDEFAMKNSAYSQPLRGDWEPLAATGYQTDGKPVDGKYDTHPELAAAGLWTTPEDLARFAIGIQEALAGKSHRVISQKMAEQMVTRQIESEGLGLYLEGHDQALRFNHNGGVEGFECMLVAYARTGQGAIVMTNSGHGLSLTFEILRAIAREYKWQDYGAKEHSVIKVEREVLRGYVGRYHIGPDLDLTITLEGDQLFQQPAGYSKDPLYPESPREFFSRAFGSELTFVTDAHGCATELILHGSEHHAKRIE